MWLPDSNERKLLAEYYRKVRQRCFQSGHSPFEPISLPHNNIVIVFQPKAALDFDWAPGADFQNKQMDNRFKRYLDCLAHIFALNLVLQERGLIKLPKGQTLSYTDDLQICLTPSGYDLGCKYNKCWRRWHLWWLEYKDSFLWPILAFFFGSLVTYIITRHN
jgi:hypothetical protein